MNKTQKILLAIVVVAVLGSLVYYIVHKPKQSSHTIAVSITPQVSDMITKEVADLELKIKNHDTAGEADLMNVYIGLGIDYKALGDFDKAKQAFIQATQERNVYLPWVNLGDLYLSVKDNDSAKQAYEKALSLGNDQAGVWEKWIDFNHYQLMASDADIRSLYTSAFQSTHDDLQLHRDYASYLQFTLDYNGALAQWQQILKANPKDTAAPTQIANLKKLLKK